MDVVDTVWETVRYYKDKKSDDTLSYEKILSECVNNILKRAMIEHSEDNLTVIIVCFKNLVEC